jgi:hypothetical protein
MSKDMPHVTYTPYNGRVCSEVLRDHKCIHVVKIDPCERRVSLSLVHALHEVLDNATVGFLGPDNTDLRHIADIPEGYTFRQHVCEYDHSKFVMYSWGDITQRHPGFEIPQMPVICGTVLVGCILDTSDQQSDCLHIVNAEQSHVQIFQSMIQWLSEDEAYQKQRDAYRDRGQNFYDAYVSG